MKQKLHSTLTRRPRCHCFHKQPLQLLVFQLSSLTQKALYALYCCSWFRLSHSSRLLTHTRNPNSFSIHTKQCFTVTTKKHLVIPPSKDPPFPSTLPPHLIPSPHLSFLLHLTEPPHFCRLPHLTCLPQFI